ncbi:hypothetical protein F0L74_27225 [Chitinophaga agrisoli]|uniref:Dolichyl-phosphate-mannose-protein mannosyltransferase n=1 Tax=Chitinophaga agrisoli TaxID=2607653 RepID=A0A5B2VLD4_9BACT|nr:hypothetical protein [Chitinophaga agrisoli]KAA2239881.1 hypothetical protein F0L74_27225 [Chitinophaga agrisoli]
MKTLKIDIKWFRIARHVPVSSPFIDWLWSAKAKVWMCTLYGIAIVLQIIFYKYHYPYPSFFPDSYSYIEAAAKDWDVNIWATGYSSFLAIFNYFSTSHVSLVVFQYLFLQAGILYFILSVSFLLGVGRVTLHVLLIGNLFNPLLLYVANFVSSDAVFTGVSLIWITQLLWILFRPSVYLFLFHAIALLVAFSVRYNALYYPVISLLVIAVSKNGVWKRLVGVMVVVLLMGGYVVRTMYLHYKVTGFAQFSIFGGWQLASNALFAYSHVVPLDPIETVPHELKELHAVTNRHMRYMDSVLQRPDMELSIYYLWDNRAPLKTYMHERFKEDDSTEIFKRWAAVSPLYGKYGAFLIKRHPGAFMRYYLIPNMIHYYVPPTEFLIVYNMGRDTLDNIAVSWFRLKSNKVHSSSSGREIKIVKVFPLFLAMVNWVFVSSYVILILLFRSGLESSFFKTAINLVAFVWICNLLFGVFSSPVVLRYQVFPQIFTLTFSLLILSYIVQLSNFKKT